MTKDADDFGCIRSTPPARSDQGLDKNRCKNWIQIMLNIFLVQCRPGRVLETCHLAILGMLKKQKDLVRYERADNS